MPPDIQHVGTDASTQNKLQGIFASLPQKTGVTKLLIYGVISKLVSSLFIVFI